MASATSFGVLGAHTAPPGAGWYDAVDLVVTLDTGAEVLFGVRTDRYLRERVPGEERWDGGYVPLAAELDAAAVRSWDFGSILWVGPEVAPCLVLTNAEALSVDGVRALLARPRAAELLAGPGGAGLPTPAELGVAVPDGLARHEV